MSVWLARVVGALLERRLSRRGALARFTLSATALAVAPLRYLLRPTTAMAVVMGPSDCGPGDRCNDGYTAFCCEIDGGANICPETTYIAGWWKCTDYRGHGLCSGQGQRYYVDCNRIPGQVFPEGCHCAQGHCSHRRVDCNAFRYGQCNTQVVGATEVVCRVEVCEHPALVEGFNCNATLKLDDTTCGHDAGCLKPLVTQLPGQGGA